MAWVLRASPLDSNYKDNSNYTKSLVPDVVSTAQNRALKEQKLHSNPRYGHDYGCWFHQLRKILKRKDWASVFDSPSASVSDHQFVWLDTHTKKFFLTTWNLPVFLSFAIFSGRTLLFATCQTKLSFYNLLKSLCSP